MDYEALGRALGELGKTLQKLDNYIADLEIRISALENQTCGVERELREAKKSGHGKTLAPRRQR